MCSLLPLFPGQLERWAQPRPEPVSLELPGYRVRVHEPDETHPNRRIWWYERDPSRVFVTRTWDSPRSPGLPMAESSRRAIVVAGRETQLVTTSLFEGVARRVLVFWLSGKGYGVEYHVRVVLEGGDEALDTVLERIEIHW